MHQIGGNDKTSLLAYTQRGLDHKVPRRRGNLGLRIARLFDPAGQDIIAPHKFRDKARGGGAVDVLGRTDLSNLALGHDHNAIRHGKGL